MLPGETPQGVEIYKSTRTVLQPILSNLLFLSQRTAEKLSGESVEIQAREAKIGRMKTGVDVYLKEWEKAPEKNTLIESVSKARETFEEKKETGTEQDAAKEAYQIALTGFLFAQNKELYKADKGSLTAFDSSKEQRQIEGVLRAVNETAAQHLHIGTGEGKSTVILPITALVEAATNKNGKVVLGSANGILVDELRHNTRRLADVMSSTIPCFKDKVKLNAVGNAETGENEVPIEDLSMQMTKDVFLTGAISEETREKQKNNFWQQYTQGGNGNMLLIDRDTDAERAIDIYIGEEKDLVFKWMDDPEQFKEKCPKIFMDEAHVAYDKGTPYSQTGRSEAIGEEDIKTGVSKWLIHYIVAQEIKETDVTASGGGYELTDDARKKLDSIQIHRIDKNNESSYSRSFYAGVDIILESIDIHMEGKQKDRFTHKLKEEMVHNVPGGKSLGEGEAGDEAQISRKDYIQSVGDEIAKFVKLREKIFTEKAGKVIIRDAYIDELLSEHKYTPTAQSAVLAITGLFEPIKRETAYKTATYPSFVEAVGDKLVALSGTLMYPDQKEQVMKKGSFAKFLKRITGCETYTISTPEMKAFPQPQLFEFNTKMYEKLSLDIKKDERPALIVDFNGLESAMKTFEYMKSIYGEDIVRLLPAKPSGGDIQDEKNYLKQLDEYRGELAQGMIKVLISSGSAALGVNFEKPDGSFPDMRTVMLGLPDSEERIVQTIARRRMIEGDGGNHLWYLSLPDVETQVSLLEKQTKRYYIGTQKSQQQMHTALLKAIKSPEKTYDLIKTLMREVKFSKAQDEKYTIRYDSLINDEVIPHATNRLAIRIATELLGYDKETSARITNLNTKMESVEGKSVSEEDKIKKLILDTYVRTFGLPSTIHDDAQSTSFIYALEQKEIFGAHFTEEQFEIKMRLLKQGIFGTTPASFNIDRYTDEWFEAHKKTVDDYMKVTEYAQNAATLVHLQDPAWSSSFYVTRQVDTSVYNSTNLRQTISLSNAMEFEIREVLLPKGGKERYMFVTQGQNHFALFNATGQPICAPNDQSIEIIRIETIQSLVRVSIDGQVAEVPLSFISLQ